MPTPDLEALYAELDPVLDQAWRHELNGAVKPIIERWLEARDAALAKLWDSLGAEIAELKAENERLWTELDTATRLLRKAMGETE